MPKHKLNVQQQNLEIEQRIRRTAAHWRAHAMPEALRTCAESRGVQWDRSIIIDLEIDFPGMPQLWGLLLTQDEAFIKFEISTDPSHTNIESVDTWEDVSHEQDLGLHNRGTGIGGGMLAIQVLRSLKTTRF